MLLPAGFTDSGGPDDKDNMHMEGSIYLLFWVNVLNLQISHNVEIVVAPNTILFLC